MDSLECVLLSQVMFKKEKKKRQIQEDRFPYRVMPQEELKHNIFHGLENFPRKKRKIYEKIQEIFLCFWC